GPPIEKPETSTISNHIGAGPGHSTSASSGTPITATMSSTSVERRSGWRWVSAPISGPPTTATTTSTVITAEAAGRRSPSPAVRYGYPHIMENVSPVKPAVKWVKNPSCVDGWRMIRASTSEILVTSCFTRGRGTPGGVARTTSSASSAATALTEAAEEKAVPQPATVSTATKGTAERI